MTPLSNRYAVACAALLAVALGIATLASQRTENIDDCANPTALAESDRFDGIQPFRTDDQMLSEVITFWSHSRIKLNHKLIRPFNVAIVRTHDPIRFYLQPDNVSSMPNSPDKGEFEWVEKNGQKYPLNLLYTESRTAATYRTTFTAYMFLYDNEPVAHPFFAQLRTAIPDFFSGRRPLTMLLVRGVVAKIYLDQATTLAKEWLIDTSDRYREICAG